MSKGAPEQPWPEAHQAAHRTQKARSMQNPALQSGNAKVKGGSLLFQHGSASSRGNIFTRKCFGDMELLQVCPGIHHPSQPPRDGAMGNAEPGHLSLQNKEIRGKGN